MPNAHIQKCHEAKRLNILVCAMHNPHLLTCPNIMIDIATWLIPTIFFTGAIVLVFLALHECKRQTPQDPEVQTTPMSSLTQLTEGEPHLFLLPKYDHNKDLSYR
jgi:hypothetical protein